MKLGIIAVGKARKGPESLLTETYLDRLPHSAGLSEVESRLTAGPQRTLDEGRRIMSVLDGTGQDSLLVCLDPFGRDISSEALADFIHNSRQNRHPACFFAIGGADGHSAEVLGRAHQKFAFGTATWPHLLCRAMLAEQLYRAEMILKGHPYHRKGPAQ